MRTAKDTAGVIPPSPEVRAENLHVSAFVAMAALSTAMVGQGGFHPPVAILCAVLLACAAALELSTFRLRRRCNATSQPLRPLLLGLAAMATTVGVTGLIDGHPVGIPVPLIALGGIAMMATVASGAGVAGRQQMATMASGLGVVVAASGWVGVVWRLPPFGHPDGGLWRAATTVTYANAAAAILSVLALGALARGVADRRASNGLVATALLIGLGATLSRAGVLGFAFGVVVLAVLVGPGRLVRSGASPVLGAAVALAALADGMPVARSGGPWVAIAGTAIGLAIGATGFAGRSAPRWRPFHRRSRRLALLTLVAGVAILAGAAVASHSQVWSGRMGAASPDRAAVARVALATWRDHLLTGVGPGRGLFVWTTAHNGIVFDRYAHDEYLQLAVEEGATGLLGLAALLIGIAVTAGRGLRQQWDRRSDSAPWLTSAGAAAGLASLLLHSGFDFLWHVPAVLLIAGLSVGLASAGAHRSADPQLQPDNQEVPCPTRDP